jgi:hypothetical protein
VTNENFRRELGHVFDDMAGSPSAALPDRVRSSLAAAPEHSGPFWIAGVAAGRLRCNVLPRVRAQQPNAPGHRLPGLLGRVPNGMGVGGSLVAPLHSRPG